MAGLPLCLSVQLVGQFGTGTVPDVNVLTRLDARCMQETTKSGYVRSTTMESPDLFRFRGSGPGNLEVTLFREEWTQVGVEGEGTAAMGGTRNSNPRGTVMSRIIGGQNLSRSTPGL